jgi:glutamate synthase (NADPH) large chain
MAYVYDPDGLAPTFMNMETLVTVPVTVDHWETELKSLILRHADETGSVRAHQILQDWDIEKQKFVQICPKEMLPHIPVPLSLEEDAIPAE